MSKTKLEEDINKLRQYYDEKINDVDNQLYSQGLQKTAEGTS